MKAQEWLDQNYPKEERSKVEEINLTEPSLEGELDLSDFTYCDCMLGIEFCAKVYIYPNVDASKLVIKNQEKNVEIILIDAQRHINYHYPTREDREQVKELQISFKKLEGDLDLSDFVNLKELYCEENRLTTLNLSNCDQLEQIYCDDNLLTNLTLPTNLNNLKYLFLRNNNFPVQDLSFLVGATNLVSLSLGNQDEKKIQQGIYNRWNGSLNYLSEMEKLNGLVIENTDISIGLEYLPNSLRGFWCSITYRPEAGVKNIEQALSKYGKPDESHLNNYIKLLAIWRTNNQSLINKLSEEKYCQKLSQLEQNLEQFKQKTQKEIEQLNSRLTRSEQDKHELQEQIQKLQTEIKVLKQEQLIAQIQAPSKTNN